MSTTQTDTLPDVDLDQQIPCEWKAGNDGTIPCHRPAVWLATTTCCRRRSAACDTCRQTLIRQLAGDGPFHCNDCRTWLNAPDWLTWWPL